MGREASAFGATSVPALSLAGFLIAPSWTTSTTLMGITAGRRMRRVVDDGAAIGCTQLDGSPTLPQPNHRRLHRRTSAMANKGHQLEIQRTFGHWSAKVFADSVTSHDPSRVLYLSGMGAEDVDDGHIRHAGDIEGQTRYSYEKLKNVLARHGATMENVVKITAYLTQASHRDAYTRSRLEAFGDAPLSAHTFVVVQSLAWPDMLVEVDATAILPA
jgi:2-iminobutanoate/2-iminopropanoate deaminase